ncbi:unnamed protein product [Didymodactylos carnosus]|uniref:Uncharacterized protein n=1 Tax=Didymodactylos carnosus TaxID=1234261 RepID=A0A813X453_9BILA|nr:unnamed protein product [Didymodactylos carnosus]CAF0972571.1 unnamed protein product [Didymodactylos carnosus]CAF3657620.1 unnamed protein product [Didymodactylos carnosus]CAF3743888.1 unnamed protein product [Didymodactylos carnosus]
MNDPKVITSQRATKRKSVQFHHVLPSDNDTVCSASFIKTKIQKIDGQYQVSRVNNNDDISENLNDLNSKNSDEHLSSYISRSSELLNTINIQNTLAYRTKNDIIDDDTADDDDKSSVEYSPNQEGISSIIINQETLLSSESSIQQQRPSTSISEPINNNNKNKRLKNSRSSTSLVTRKSSRTKKTASDDINTSEALKDVTAVSATSNDSISTVTNTSTIITNNSSVRRRSSRLHEEKEGEVSSIIAETANIIPNNNKQGNKALTTLNSTVDKTLTRNRQKCVSDMNNVSEQHPMEALKLVPDSSVSSETLLTPLSDQSDILVTTHNNEVSNKQTVILKQIEQNDVKEYDQARIQPTVILNNQECDKFVADTSLLTKSIRDSTPIMIGEESRQTKTACSIVGERTETNINLDLVVNDEVEKKETTTTIPVKPQVKLKTKAQLKPLPNEVSSETSKVKNQVTTKISQNKPDNNDVGKSDKIELEKSIKTSINEKTSSIKPAKPQQQSLTNKAPSSSVLPISTTTTTNVLDEKKSIISKVTSTINSTQLLNSENTNKNRSVIEKKTITKPAPSASSQKPTIETTKKLSDASSPAVTKKTTNDNVNKNLNQKIPTTVDSAIPTKKTQIMLGKIPKIPQSNKPSNETTIFHYKRFDNNDREKRNIVTDNEDVLAAIIGNNSLDRIDKNFRIGKKKLNDERHKDDENNFRLNTNDNIEARSILDSDYHSSTLTLNYLSPERGRQRSPNKSLSSKTSSSPHSRRHVRPSSSNSDSQSPTSSFSPAKRQTHNRHPQYNNNSHSHYQQYSKENEHEDKCHSQYRQSHNQKKMSPAHNTLSPSPSNDTINRRSRSNEYNANSSQVVSRNNNSHQQYDHDQSNIYSRSKSTNMQNAMTQSPSSRSPFGIIHSPLKPSVFEDEPLVSQTNQSLVENVLTQNYTSLSSNDTLFPSHFSLSQKPLSVTKTVKESSIPVVAIEQKPSTQALSLWEEAESDDDQQNDHQQANDALRFFRQNMRAVDEELLKSPATDIKNDPLKTIKREPSLSYTHLLIKQENTSFTKQPSTTMSVDDFETVPMDLDSPKYRTLSDNDMAIDMMDNDKGDKKKIEGDRESVAKINSKQRTITDTSSLTKSKISSPSRNKKKGDYVNNLKKNGSSSSLSNQNKAIAADINNKPLKTTSMTLIDELKNSVNPSSVSSNVQSSNHRPRTYSSSSDVSYSSISSKSSRGSRKSKHRKTRRRHHSTNKRTSKKKSSKSIQDDSHQVQSERKKLARNNSDYYRDYNESQNSNDEGNDYFYDTPAHLPPKIPISSSLLSHPTVPFSHHLLHSSTNRTGDNWYPSNRSSFTQAHTLHHLRHLPQNHPHHSIMPSNRVYWQSSAQSSMTRPSLPAHRPFHEHLYDTTTPSSCYSTNANNNRYKYESEERLAMKQAQRAARITGGGTVSSTITTSTDNLNKISATTPLNTQSDDTNKHKQTILKDKKKSKKISDEKERIGKKEKVKQSLVRSRTKSVSSISSQDSVENETKADETGQLEQLALMREKLLAELKQLSDGEEEDDDDDDDVEETKSLKQNSTKVEQKCIVEPDSKLESSLSNNNISKKNVNLAMNEIPKSSDEKQKQVLKQTIKSPQDDDGEEGELVDSSSE